MYYYCLHYEFPVIKVIFKQFLYFSPAVLDTAGQEVSNMISFSILSGGIICYILVF